MSNVQSLLKQDARRQLFFGIILSSTALFFIIGIFAELGTFVQGVIYGIALGASGTALLLTSRKDFIRAKSAISVLPGEEEHKKIAKLPQQMYLGEEYRNLVPERLYGLDKQIYSELKEKDYFLRSFFRMFTGIVGSGVLVPADYKMVDGQGRLIYSLEKKGGFKWRGYVKDQKQQYIAYAEQSKNKATGQRIYQYIEGHHPVWSAEGDPYLAHYVIKDEKGVAWAVLKQGATSVEAAQQFEGLPGSLIEWKVNEQVPYSLIAFIYLIQTHHS
ncbi:hypothetical protein Q7A53_12390 [Halobacillus rhizosphaerae]|uniref:hypothetical protein n=1 Tax=Halobacillus rhizosphaerae TaxID=3064889 RepID=UPI00398A7032